MATGALAYVNWPVLSSRVAESLPTDIHLHLRLPACLSTDHKYLSVYVCHYRVHVRALHIYSKLAFTCVSAYGSAICMHACKNGQSAKQAVFHLVGRIESSLGLWNRILNSPLLQQWISHAAAAACLHAYVYAHGRWATGAILNFRGCIQSILGLCVWNRILRILRSLAAAQTHGGHASAHTWPAGEWQPEAVPPVVHVHHNRRRLHDDACTSWIQQHAWWCTGVQVRFPSEPLTFGTRLDLQSQPIPPGPDGNGGAPARTVH